MLCKCGYDGLAQIGRFPDERFGGKYKLMPYMNSHFRCPKCKTNKDMEHINAIDSVREALTFPRGRFVSFLTGCANKETVGYSIVNAKGWGCSSAISRQEYEDLKKEFPQLNIGRVTQSCDNALRSIGIDPKRFEEVTKSLVKDGSES